MTDGVVGETAVGAGGWTGGGPQGPRGGAPGVFPGGVTQLCGNSPDDWPGCGAGHFVPDADFEQDPSADYQSVHERGGNAGFAWDDTQGHSGTQD